MISRKRDGAIKFLLAKLTLFHGEMENISAKAYVISCALIALATLLASFAFGLFPEASLDLIYLLAIVISAQYFGLWPSVLASVMAILAWDYFFTRPYFSLEVTSERDFFNLAFFLIVALIVSGMTSVVRNQNIKLRHLAENNRALYEVSEDLASFDTVSKIALYAIDRASTVLHRKVSIFLDNPNHGGRIAEFSQHVSNPDNKLLTQHDLSAALYYSEATQAQPRDGATYIVMNALRGRVGAVKVFDTDVNPLSLAESGKMSALMSQVAVAIERLWLFEENRQSIVDAETERMRNALLISVSHDLRTPLTSIIGSLTTIQLLSYPISDDSQLLELTSVALIEAQRLDRFIANLLDMTNLEMGGLNITFSPVNLEEVILSCVDRAQPLLQRHIVVLDIPDKIPSVRAHFQLLEQALFNLLDNAAKYCPIETQIALSARTQDGNAFVDVLDQGPGIPAELLKVLFQKFARATLSDTKPPGTGLGLAIAKGFMLALGGDLTAGNRQRSQGAIFSMRIPLMFPDEHNGKLIAIEDV